MTDNIVATFGNITLTDKCIKFVSKKLTSQKTQTIFLQDISLVNMDIKSHSVYLVVAAVCFALLFVGMSVTANLISFGIGIALCIAFWKIKTYTLIITPHAGAGKEIACEVIGAVNKEQADDFMEKLNTLKDKYMKRK